MAASVAAAACGRNVYDSTSVAADADRDVPVIADVWRCRLAYILEEANVEAFDRGGPISDLEARFPGRYLSLTSFRRDGTAVATPMWFVIDGGRLLVTTDPKSGKVKRIGRDPRVMLAPCTASGRLRGEQVQGRAEVLPAEELEHVERLMALKYRVDRVVVLPVYRLLQRLRGTPVGKAEVALAITAG